MKLFVIFFITLFCFACANNAQKPEAKPITNFRYEIKLALIDTLDSDTCFWKINRQMEKETPKNFKHPLDMADTANKFYITHWVKRYRITYQGKTSYLNSVPFYCVAKEDTAKFNQLIVNPSYQSFFPEKPVFAYGVDVKNNMNGYLNLYKIFDNAVSFKGAEIKSVVFTDAHRYPEIEVELNETAGKRLAAFLKEYLHKKIAILINGIVFSNQKIYQPLDKNYFAIPTLFNESEVNQILSHANN
ncbi:hypothetical protein FAM09_07410 [Niastella caeni]|uniref:SecDF P1 head subdomain domain-containing protein n=1 Tax=Niastella caeni TaxID=2569763 RepID=A0A4S8I1P5_9BACT|nr:hypothetical protein [Niastella caeni]THU41920.1 hypothetical protein FAM09_07410 [Niastella caeni]